MKKVMMMFTGIALMGTTVFAANLPNNKDGKSSGADSSANTQAEVLMKEKEKLEAENENLKLELAYTKMMSNMLLKIREEANLKIDVKKVAEVKQSK